MILVTGGSGFIGSHLVERLVAEREPVRCLVRRRKVKAAPGVELVEGDLVSGAGLDAALRGVSCVIHLAGVTKALSVREYYDGNARASENLARAAMGRGIRFVHVSSLGAIGPGAEGAPVTEDTPPHPIGHYGRSKLAGEGVVRELLPDAVIVRPPVVYGPRDTDLFHLLHAISRGFVVRIAGGERWFSAIYAADLAVGLLVAARAPQAAGRAYFLAHEPASSLTELGEISRRIMGITPHVLTIPMPVAYAVGAIAEGWAQLTRQPGIISREKAEETQYHWWTCDAGRAAAELGFTAPTSLAAGLAVTLPWYREAGWLKY